MCWPRRNSRTADTFGLLRKTCEHRRANVTLHTIMSAELVAWAQLPGDIACLILRQLPASDLVNARQVCAHYAHLACQEPPLEMLLRVDPDDLSISQAGSRKQLQHQLHKSCFILRVTNLLSLRMLEGFLKQLDWQVWTCTLTQETSVHFACKYTCQLPWCGAD